MRRRFFVFCLLLTAVLPAGAEEVRKFYEGDPRVVRLKGVPDPGMTLTIQRILDWDKPEEQDVSTRPVAGKPAGRNLWQRIRGRKRTYHYSIPFHELPPGFYSFYLSGPVTKKKICVLISRYRLVTRLLYGRGSHYLLDTRTGQPVPYFSMLQIAGQTVRLAQKEKYFYEGDLLRTDQRFVALYSNQMDLSDVPAGHAGERKAEPAVFIVLPKDVYHIGENLHFLALIKRKDLFQYTHGLVEEVRVSLYDAKGLLVKSRTFRKIDQGYVNDYFALDDSFTEGVYHIEAAAEGIIERRKISLLRKNSPEYEIVLWTGRETYYEGEKIVLNASVSVRYGPPLSQGDIFCEVWFRPLGAQENYQYASTLRKRLNGRRLRFALNKPDFLKSGSYDLKFIVKVRSHNGMTEGQYKKVRMLKADFDLVLKTPYNIFEVENPVLLRYRILRLTRAEKPKRFLLRLYRVLDADMRDSRLISTTDLSGSPDEITLRLKQTGLYRALFTLTDRKNNRIEKSVSFLVLSYTYGIDPPKDLKGILLREDKREYGYSDIGKLFMMFPSGRVWYNVTFEGSRIFSNNWYYTEKNYALLDFPVNEEYSPGIFVHVSVFHKGRLFSRKIRVKVPFLNKILKVNSVISNSSVTTNGHRVRLRAVNYWNHDMNAYIQFYTLKSGFVELYNQELYSPYDRVYLSAPDRFVRIPGTEPPSGPASPVKREQSGSGLFYSDYLINSFYNYDFSPVPKKEGRVQDVRFREHGDYQLVSFSFTDDLKFGLDRVSRVYRSDAELVSRVPAYLSLKDRSFLTFILKNKKTAPMRSKFHFTIMNGKYKSEAVKFLDVPGKDRRKVMLSFKPLYRGPARLNLGLFMPTQNQEQSYDIKLVSSPDIRNIKSRLIHIKKRYYTLKYQSDDQEYYSKLKYAGSSFPLGEDVLVNLRITARKSVKNIRIVDYLPAGFEYVENHQNYHLYRIEPNLNYGVIRQDEKLVFPVPELTRGVNNIYYILKARQSGRYYQPGFYALQSDKTVFSCSENRYFTIH